MDPQSKYKGGVSMNIFDFAMQMEQDGEAYYRELAAKSGEAGLKHILNMLADDEQKHYQIMKSLKESVPAHLVETKVLEEANNIFAQMRQQGPGEMLELGQEELYRKAQDLEKKSEDFYKEKAGELGEKALKDIFLGIAGEEARHYFLLDNIITFVSRPHEWIENAEFHHLVEY